ncbi:MAG: hypothetical protein LBV43_05385 [Prevotella sp.]|jgi:hypothetical protein|nr:hypothetical protein [Prevotella sp.]
MIQIPLITEKLFKQHSPVTTNTDITEFVPYISIAQELHIAPLLGETLISELKDQIAGNSLTAENSDLILKMAPALSFYAVYQALPFHWATIVNKGITIRESENSKGVNINDIAQLRRWIKDDAQLLATQLIAFLCQCRNNYPLWLPPSNCCNKAIGEDKSQIGFDSGFYFPKKKKGCC